MNDGDLVAVIIPAYNAASTLGDTLDSVCNQTHRNLDIVVVDDGSQDDTAAIALAHAGRDARIRLIRQENGGVARARNAGAAASHAAYLAPVDADDLWHPDKIARQLAALHAAGPDTGYTYTLYRRIDMAGRILMNAGFHVEGAAFLRLISENYVGNGSSLLIRRAAFEDAGGYEPRLRDIGMQGCEDYLLQLRIARTWRVVGVPAYLTGYRRLTGAMSENDAHMAHARCAVYDMLEAEFPETPARRLNAARAHILAQSAIMSFRKGRYAALKMLGAAFAADARTAARIFADRVSLRARRLAQRALPGLSSDGPGLGQSAPEQRPHFYEYDPDRTWGRHNPFLLAEDSVAEEEAFFLNARPRRSAGADTTCCWGVCDAKGPA